MAFQNKQVKLWTSVPWGFGLGITTDGRNIIVSDISPSLILFLDHQLNVIKSFTPTTSMHGLSYDGKYLWGVSNGTDSVYQFTTDGTLIRSWAVGTGTVLGITTNEKCVFVNFNDNVKMFSKSGTLIKTVTVTGTRGGNRGLMTDGKNFFQLDTAGITLTSSDFTLLRTFARTSNWLLNLGAGRFLNIRQTQADLLI